MNGGNTNNSSSEDEQRLVMLAGDGKTDSDDETCRTFIFRYDVIARR